MVQYTINSGNAYVLDEALRSTQDFKRFDGIPGYRMVMLGCFTLAFGCDRFSQSMITNDMFFLTIRLEIIASCSQTIQRLSNKTIIFFKL